MLRLLHARKRRGEDAGWCGRARTDTSADGGRGESEGGAEGASRVRGHLGATQPQSALAIAHRLPSI
eukprot:3385931-Rhodomonas_salina.1